MKVKYNKKSDNYIIIDTKKKAAFYKLPFLKKL